MRSTSLLAVAFLAVIVLIAAFAKTEIVVTGRGQLRADTPTILLQPVERAIIRTLAVRAGDHVSKGQLVATLDPTFTDADLHGLGKMQQTLDARIGRLRAELSASPPPALADGDEAHSMEARIYAQRRNEFAQRLASFDQSIARSLVALKANRVAAEALSRQLAIATDIAAMRSTLLQSAVGSKLQYLAAETSRIEAEKDFKSAQDQIIELSHAIDGARADRQAFVAQWQRTDMEDMIAARQALEKVQDDLAKATRLHELIRLHAPCDGIVLDVAARAPGSVLHEAEPLVTILPAGAAMIADVSVPSAEIGQLADGQKVILKVDAFPYQQHGMLHGTVRSIGEETTPDPRSGVAMHRVQITLSDTHLNAVPSSAALFPGMTVTAEVTVGARNVLAYFLYPITRGFRDSMREP